MVGKIDVLGDDLKDLYISKEENKDHNFPSNFSEREMNQPMMDLDLKVRELVSSGCGEGIYHSSEAERKDSRFPSRLDTIAKTLNCTVSLVSNLTHLDKIRSNERGCMRLFSEKPTSYSPVYHIRKYLPEDFIEVRIAVVGNVDAGKSTLLGVLTKGILDDGRGKARIGLLRHKHELESGRTSSVGNEILGFDAKGDRIEIIDSKGKKLSWDDICESSSKIVSFMDLAGHEKYLKTTMFGLTGYVPDYALLMMGSNAGLVGMAKEHLAITFALNVPVIIVITKIDMTPTNVAEQNLNQLMRLLRSASCQRAPILVRNSQESISIMKNFTSERYCPIFQISSVTGMGIPLLSQFLNLIPSRSAFQVLHPMDPMWIEYQITESYDVHGVGTVVAGTLMAGCVRPGQMLFLGPDGNGAFLETQVKSIQRKKMNIDIAYASQTVTFSLKKISRSHIKKGMVLLSKEPPGSKSKPNKKLSMITLMPCGMQSSLAVCYEFSAEVLILFHATTITLKYQAMLHCGVIRQTVAIVGVDESILSANIKPGNSPTDVNTNKKVEILRTGDRAIVRFRFIKKPEYMKTGLRLLFREGKTKGVGKVVKLYPETV